MKENVNKNTKTKPWIEYSVHITKCLTQLFDKDSPFYLCRVKDLKLSDFIFALSIAAPAFFYEKVTGEDLTYLDFSHLANKLLFSLLQERQNERPADSSETLNPD
jgi:hypothetical protein